MNYLSVCFGIEAATVAWHDMGWNPVGFSEIEPFPSAVLKHHYPTVPNLGDMTKYKEWNLESVNLLVGGTPCQSFSVAGLRKGLEDPRGNLALTYCGILDHFRPKWFVWENVPGVLSSNGGRDFGAFLGAVAELGYGFAYRVLDAQYFGVAQRRRRVFVVGCLGDWRSAAEVLFESDCLRRDIKPRRTQRKSITGYVESSFGQYREDVIAGTTKASGGVLSGGSETFVHAYVADKCPTITNSGAGFSRPRNEAMEAETYVACYENSRRVAIKEVGDKTNTLQAFMGTGGNNVPLVQAFRKGRRAQSTEDYETWVDDGKANTINTFDLGDIRTTHAVAYSFDSLSSNSMKSSNPVSGCNEVQLSKTLDTSFLNPTANQGGIAVAYSLREDAKANTFSATELEVSNAISALRPSPQSHHAQVFVAQPIAIAFTTEQTPKFNNEQALTLTQSEHKHNQCVLNNMAVRRLTCMECERLQGFPDGYTDIKPKNKVTPDGPRYKALGNSMAVPVMRWIGERINLINKAQEK